MGSDRFSNLALCHQLVHPITLYSIRDNLDGTPPLRYGFPVGKRPLIVGYGNTLRGDDAVGQVAAEMLADTEWEHAQIIARCQLVPELAELLAEVDLVVFVDAAVGASPGEISVSKLAASAASTTLGHHMTPGVLLSVCDGLYEHTPDAFLVSLNVASLELGEGLSDIAASALPNLLATVRHR